MAKDLTDRQQAGALTQELTGEGVPKPMGSHVWQPGPQAGPLNDIPDQVGADRAAWCPAGQEQLAGPLRVAAAGQVGDQGFADLCRQREPVLPASLAADDEFPGPPVHVAQLQARHFDRPQTQPRDEHHDREVADADGTAAVDAVQQPLDLRGRHGRRRQAGEPPPTHWRHRSPQPQRCDALQIKESQDGAEFSYPPFGRPGRHRTPGAGTR